MLEHHMSLPIHIENDRMGVCGMGVWVCAPYAEPVHIPDQGVCRMWNSDVSIPCWMTNDVKIQKATLATSMHNTCTEIEDMMEPL